MFAVRGFTNSWLSNFRSASDNPGFTDGGVMGDKRLSLSKRLIFGFIAGFFGTLIFHQFTLSVLWAAGIAPFGPFSMAPTQPFGVPAVISLSFWGGIWGILFALVDKKFPGGVAYWITAFLFGAIFPSVVALVLVLPLKGKPMGGGWHIPLMMTAFLINGAWGVGTGLILKVMTGWRSRTRE